jgi:uncharacterized protein YjaZ
MCLLAAVVGAAACRSATDASDTASPQLEFDGDLGGSADSRRLAFQRVFDEVTPGVGAVLDVRGVRVRVRADPGRAIAGYGLGGQTFAEDRIEIFVDPNFPALESVLAARFAVLLAHELHHAARWRGPGYGRTLLEAMVSEGLADRFAVEHLGVAAPPWSVALTEAALPQHIAAAAEEFDRIGYDHPAWFFGDRGLHPRWTGYAIGYRLVQNVQSRGQARSAVALTNEPAETFRPR